MFVHVHYRLDMKAQKIDKGYPRYTDVVFGGVPSDAHDVFQYKGKVKKKKKNTCRNLFSFFFP